MGVKNGMEQTAQAVNEVEVKESRKSGLMQRVWAKMGKEEKGFTLIELLAVLVIIAIIAVIAIPLIGGIINNSKEDADASTARQLYDSARLYVVGENNGDFKTVKGAGEKAVAGVVTLSMLQAGNYIDASLVLPSTKTVLDPDKTLVTFDPDTGKLTSVTLPDSKSKEAKDGVFPANVILQTPGK